jgi:hypothetical protein
MRRRIIAPDFWTDSNIVSMSYPARLLFIGLWNYADDEGYFLDDLPAIKRTLFPDQDFDIAAAFSECRRFLTEYSYTHVLSDLTRRAFKITHFLNWQVINRPTASKIKPFCKFTDDSLNAHGALTPKLSKDNININEVNEVSDQGKPDRVYTSSPKKSKPARRAPADPAQLEAFAKFYQAYPRHVARADAEKAWMELAPTAELTAKIVSGVERYSEAVKDSEPKYIKHPGAWLRARRWEDDIGRQNEPKKEVRFINA